MSKKCGLPTKYKMNHLLFTTDDVEWLSADLMRLASLSLDGTKILELPTSDGNKVHVKAKLESAR